MGTILPFDNNPLGTCIEIRLKSSSAFALLHRFFAAIHFDIRFTDDGRELSLWLAADESISDAIAKPLRAQLVYIVGNQSLDILL